MKKLKVKGSKIQLKDIIIFQKSTLKSVTCFGIVDEIKKKENGFISVLFNNVYQVNRPELPTTDFLGNPIKPGEDPGYDILKNPSVYVWILFDVNKEYVVYRLSTKFESNIIKVDYEQMEKVYDNFYDSII